MYSLNFKTEKSFLLYGFETNSVLNFFFGFFRVWTIFPRQQLLSWQTSLLCIVGDLAVGGSLAVAVGQVSEKYKLAPIKKNTKKGGSERP